MSMRIQAVAIWKCDNPACDSEVIVGGAAQVWPHKMGWLLYDLDDEMSEKLGVAVLTFCCWQHRAWYEHLHGVKLNNE